MKYYKQPNIKFIPHVKWDSFKFYHTLPKGLCNNIVSIFEPFDDKCNLIFILLKNNVVIAIDENDMIYTGITSFPNEIYTIEETYVPFSILQLLDETCEKDDFKEFMKEVCHVWIRLYHCRKWDVIKDEKTGTFEIPSVNVKFSMENKLHNTVIIWGVNFKDNSLTINTTTKVKLELEKFMVWNGYKDCIYKTSTFDVYRGNSACHGLVILKPFIAR